MSLGNPRFLGGIPPSWYLSTSYSGKVRDGATVATDGRERVRGLKVLYLEVASTGTFSCTRGWPLESKGFEGAGRGRNSHVVFP